MSEAVYNLDSAAERCGVPRTIILDWIERGLRVFPLGNSTVYRPRDFLILECWLLAFLDAHSVVAKAPPKTHGEGP